MKWWFSDYDGTINLKHDDSIDKRDLDFISSFMDRNNQFAIASGRLHNEIKDVLKNNNIKYNYIIACNGAAVYDKNDKLVQSLPIPMEDRQSILNLLLENKDLISGYCDMDERKDFNSEKISVIHDNPFFIGSVPLNNNHVEGEKDILNSGNINIIYFYGEEKSLSLVQEKANKISDRLKAIKTHTNVLEIVNKEVSKAFGIKFIMKKHSIEVGDIITSGDGENDIEMLDLTPNSFVMKTAKPNVLKHGNHQIDNVFEIGEIMKKDLG
ncbi:HAD-superfamily hydrolase [Spiroplasma sabaudiense Ar-1343]|uniref:HAD-superfamily hydrolase n=1 Tax=Spiroplasma sabaudiense Ar-1343 TaxID=1276257 RepID=W6AAR3_9MOLU|nr:HAD-IIB family hydrolase [Spiroplasma sabaudiense]AHI54243.1 HAD-superfamily hydrolase [Spiroplasma sabaudiense Ar-1343]